MVIVLNIYRWFIMVDVNFGEIVFFSGDNWEWGGLVLIIFFFL